MLNVTKRIQIFQSNLGPSSVNYDLHYTRQSDFIHAKGGKNELLLAGNDGDNARKAMCNKYQTLVHQKDRTPLRQWAGVVYWILCGSCEKVYIGQTVRTLDHRLENTERP